MKQKQMQTLIRDLKDNYGVTYAFIAELSHLSKNTITLFAKGQRVLAPNASIKLDSALDRYKRGGITYVHGQTQNIN